MEEQKKDWCKEIIHKAEEEIKKISEVGVNTENVTYLGKLIDIHKDLSNEEYWKEKIDMYRDYDDYGTYGRRMRDSRGRYRDGSYGRRGVAGTGRGRYRDGEEMLNNMYNAYNDYMDDQDYGTYGTSESMMKIEVMADSLMDFIHHLKKEAKTPEEKQLIEHKLQEIGRM